MCLLLISETSFIWLYGENSVETFVGSEHADISVSIQAYDQARCLWLKDNKYISEHDRRLEVQKLVIPMSHQMCRSKCTLEHF